MKMQYLLIMFIGLLAACQSSNSAPAPLELATTVPAENQTGKTGLVERTPPPAGQTDLPTALPTELTLPPTSMKTEPLSPLAKKMASLSQVDLSKRLNISVDEIAIKAAQPVIWPDASLGCPQPEIVYAQVETKGFIILLEVKPDVFLYHTDQVGAIIFCTKPTGAPEFPVTPSDIKDGKPWMPVD